MRQYKLCNPHSRHADTEIGMYAPLTKTGTDNMVNELGECYYSQSAALWGYIFQIIFQVSLTLRFVLFKTSLKIEFYISVCCTQMTAGAVMLTDSVYWFVIFPFLTIVDYEMSFVSLYVLP